MKRLIILFLIIVAFTVAANAQSNELKIVFLRHAEKPEKGDNLTCQGLNRSLLIPAMLTKRFGVPDFTFVPGLGLGENTKHSRMFENVVPLAAKYNLTLNSSHKERDSSELAADLKSKKGLVLVVWEHKAIAPILHALGINTNLTWPDDDYDSIWIITFKNGAAVLIKDKEGLKPGEGCPFK
jgi:hypothetical protein